MGQGGLGQLQRCPRGHRVQFMEETELKEQVGTRIHDATEMFGFCFAGSEEPPEGLK